MKKNKVMAVAMTAAILFGAFLCCSIFSEDSDAAFSSHESNRGTMTNSTVNNATSSGIKIYGTILNPYTGIDVDLRSMSGGHNVFIKTGSSVKIVTGTTTHFHTHMLNLGWSYSDGIYTCIVNSNMQIRNNGSCVYLSSGNYLNVHAISNPGFITNGEYWYGGTTTTEPALGINIPHSGYITTMDSNIYVAVGASVYIGPYSDGEQWINSNNIGLSQTGNGSITGTISRTGTASLGFFDPNSNVEGTVTLVAVEYSEPTIITASDMVVIQNTTLTFTPVPAGNTVSISGADWLSVNGNVVSGTPTVVGDYTVTITSGVSSKTITIRVISQLNVTNSPANGVIIMPS